MKRGQLAEAAGVSVETIRGLEHIDGRLNATLNTIQALTRALEEIGIEFIPGGARLRTIGEQSQIRNSIEIYERILNGWNNLDELEAQRVSSNVSNAISEFTFADLEGQKLRWELASALILAHRKGEATLPPEVASWLFLQIDEMLSGNPPLNYHSKLKGQSRSKKAQMYEAIAVEYIKLAEDRVIEDDNAIETVAYEFKQSPLTVSRWVEKYSPHGSLKGLIIAGLPPGANITLHAKQHLREVATLWREEVAPKKAKNIAAD
jgi:hypothetical protein